MFNIITIRRGKRPTVVPSSYRSLSTNAAFSNGYATFPSIAAYGTFGDFTFEFWIKRSAFTSANGRIIDFDYFNGWTMNRSGSTSKLSMGGKSGSVVASASDLAQDTWTHIAFVRSGSTGLIYFNGNLDNSGSVSNGTFLYSIRPDFGIGVNISDNPGGDRETFKMTDLRVWKEARSQAQISANMNSHLTGSETNLVANWQFNLGSLVDSTSNANTMSLYPNASISTDVPY